MPSKDEFLEALDDFGHKPADTIPRVLELYLQQVAMTGETMFPWSKVKPLFYTKLDNVLKEFHEQVPTDHFPPSPNVENINFDDMRKRLLDYVETFTGAPFTIQRLCELLTEPMKHYKRSDKFMRGIEKNIQVVSAVDPRGNKIVSEAKLLVNGLDANGLQQGAGGLAQQVASPFLPPPPTNSPAGGGWPGRGARGATPDSPAIGASVAPTWPHGGGEAMAEEADSPGQDDSPAKASPLAQPDWDLAADEGKGHGEPAPKVEAPAGDDTAKNGGDGATSAATWPTSSSGAADSQSESSKQSEAAPRDEQEPANKEDTAKPSSATDQTPVPDSDLENKESGSAISTSPVATDPDAAPGSSSDSSSSSLSSSASPVSDGEGDKAAPSAAEPTVRTSLRRNLDEEDSASPVAEKRIRLDAVDEAMDSSDSQQSGHSSDDSLSRSDSGGFETSSQAEETKAEPLEGGDTCRVVSSSCTTVTSSTAPTTTTCTTDGIKSDVDVTSGVTSSQTDQAVGADSSVSAISDSVSTASDSVSDSVSTVSDSVSTVSDPVSTVSDLVSTVSGPVEDSSEVDMPDDGSRASASDTKIESGPDSSSSAEAEMARDDGNGNQCSSAGDNLQADGAPSLEGRTSSPGPNTAASDGVSSASQSEDAEAAPSGDVADSNTSAAPSGSAGDATPDEGDHEPMDVD